jgi:hypothetical protein
MRLAAAARRLILLFAMKPFFVLLSAAAALACNTGLAAQTTSSDNPADHLPAHIKRITWFGERADWSPDGQRILFLAKTFGEVYEVEVATGIIRAVTRHYSHWQTQAGQRTRHS